MSFGLTAVVLGLVATVLMPAPRESPPITCRRDAFTPAERALHARLSEELKAAVRDVEELENGYVIRLGAAPVTVAQWAELDRLCCPFWDFALELKAGESTLSLRITGPAGAKEILAGVLAPARNR